MYDNTPRRSLLAYMRLARLNAELGGHEIGRWSPSGPNVRQARCLKCWERVYAGPSNYAGSTPVFPCQFPHNRASDFSKGR